MVDQVKNALHQIVSIVPSQETMDAKVLSKVFETLANQFDPNYGGFGKAPKFPSSMTLSFLLRFWKSTESTQGRKKSLINNIEGR